MKIFFILLFFNYTTSINYIILPLKKNREVFSQYQNILELLLNNEVYSEFYIGSPPQILKGFFNFLEHDSYIKKKTINGVFDEQKSSTYISEKERLYYNSKYSKGFPSKDYLIFNNSKSNSILKNFSFVLASNITSEINEFNIGLKPKEFLDDTFFQQLKNGDIISSRIFCFNYNKNKMLVGTYPHEVDEKKYDKIYLRRDKIQTDTRFASFDFLWEHIYYRNQTENFTDNFKGSIFNLNIKGIICSNSFQSYLVDNFFYPYIKDNKCKQEQLKINDNEYFTFICDTDINLKNFPTLFFISQGIDFVFNLTGEDLFIKENNKYYCLISFLKGNFKWVLGEVFFKKYEIIFDLDRKSIAFYIDHPKTKFNYYIYLLFLLGIIILILIGILIKCYHYLPRKKRANELEEQFEYVTQIN